MTIANEFMEEEFFKELELLFNRYNITINAGAEHYYPWFIFDVNGKSVYSLGNTDWDGNKHELKVKFW